MFDETGFCEDPAPCKNDFDLVAIVLFTGQNRGWFRSSAMKEVRDSCLVLCILKGALYD